MSLVRGALAAAISFEIAHSLSPVPVEMVIGKQSLGGADSCFSRCEAYAVLTAPRACGLLRCHLLRRAHEDGLLALPRRHRRRWGVCLLLLYDYLGEHASHTRILLLVLFGS